MNIQNDMIQKSPNTIVVCGPTASGKTHLAVKLACRYGGEIISADSRQVYRGMDIGTGKDLDEYVREDGQPVPYHCIDIAEPRQIYTLYHYLQDCAEAFYDIRTRGILPVMAGGTGLYIEAFLKGYNVPNVPEDVSLRESLMVQSKEHLEKQLKSMDQDLYLKTDLSSKKRIVRAIEIASYAKENEVVWGNRNPPQLHPLVIGVNPPRPILYERIDRRLYFRLENGMVDEVRGLIDMGISRRRLALFGMEYKRVAEYLFKECSYREMVERLRTDIHHLAKRQVTWFRGMQRRGTDIHWVENVESACLCPIVDSD